MIVLSEVGSLKRNERERLKEVVTLCDELDFGRVHMCMLMEASRCGYLELDVVCVPTRGWKVYRERCWRLRCQQVRICSVTCCDASRMLCVPTWGWKGYTEMRWRLMNCQQV